MLIYPGPKPFKNKNFGIYTEIIKGSASKMRDGEYKSACKSGSAMSSSQD